MSITFMENFTFDGARNADGSSVVPNLNDAKNIMKRRGGDFYNGGQTLWNSATFATETEMAGLDLHSFLRMNAYYYAGSGSTRDLLGVPVNWANGVYFSMRLRINGGPANTMRYFVCSTDPSTLAGTRDLFNVWDNGAQWYIFTGYQSSFSGLIPFAYNEWVTIEVFRDSAGKVTLWANDIIIKAPTYTNTLPGATSRYYPFLYFGPKRVGSYIESNLAYDVADIVVIDPTITPGPVYRLGSSARVARIPLATDAVAQWNIPAGGIATTQRDTIKPFRAIQSPLEMVDSTVIGARDQFTLGPVPKLKVDNTLVAGVQVERTSGNTGGSAHSISMEMDTGSGIKETSVLTIPAATSNVYGNEVLNRTPEGANWTLANLAATKVGFSVKS